MNDESTLIQARSSMQRASGLANQLAGMGLLEAAEIVAGCALSLSWTVARLTPPAPETPAPTPEGSPRS